MNKKEEFTINAILNNLLVGCAALIGVAIIGKIPILGWFTWLISIGVWIWLGSRLVITGWSSLQSYENPRVAVMGWAALIGFTSGLVQTIFSLLINYLGTMNGSGLAAVSVLADFVSLFIWPIVGALICGAAGLSFGGKLERSA